MPWKMVVKRGNWGAYGKVYRAGREYVIDRQEIVDLALKVTPGHLVLTEIRKTGEFVEQEPLEPEEAPESEAPVSDVEAPFVAQTDPVVPGTEDGEQEVIEIPEDGNDYKPYVCDVPECPGAFNTEVSLMRHVTHKHKTKAGV